MMIRRKINLLAGVACLLLGLSGALQAQSVSEARRQVQASMVLTGSLDIEPDGTVSAHVIDDAAQVPDYVLAHLDRVVATWRFEPIKVDGVAVAARSAMSVRMNAVRDGDNLLISMAGASFFDRNASNVSGRSVTPPRYPPDLLRAGVPADVFVAVMVDAEGNVIQAAVE